MAVVIAKQDKTSTRQIYPNDNMHSSKIGADVLAGFEAMGFVCPDGKVRAYRDGGCGEGAWTIGIGEMSGTTPDSVYNTEQEALDHFRNQGIEKYAERVRNALRVKKVGRKLRQNEFDALISMAYQHGNCMDMAAIIAQGRHPTEQEWVSVTSAGHSDRRRKEYRLYIGQSVTTGTYSTFLSSENRNDGYCNKFVKSNGKRVLKVVRHGSSYQTPQGGYDTGGITPQMLASGPSKEGGIGGNSNSDSTSNPSGSPTMDRVGQQNVDLTAEIQTKLQSFATNITNSSGASFKPATEGEVDKSDSTGIKRIIHHT